MDVVAQYLDYLTAQGRSPATIRAVRADLRQFAAWWETTQHQPWMVELTSDRDLRLTIAHAATLDEQITALPALSGSRLMSWWLDQWSGAEGP